MWDNDDPVAPTPTTPLLNVKIEERNHFLELYQEITAKNAYPGNADAFRSGISLACTLFKRPGMRKKATPATLDKFVFYQVQFAKIIEASVAGKRKDPVDFLKWMETAPDLGEAVMSWKRVVKFVNSPGGRKALKEHRVTRRSMKEREAWLGEV